ncbi:helix-turn-helix domain-containing protein [Pedobacter steynii]|nr:helix-turn-helix transcriptional regulator [Pedobacter steynii]
MIKGYSQEYMAFRLNISQNAYSKLERGETELTVRRFYEIIEILEVPMNSLLTEYRSFDL